MTVLKGANVFSNRPGAVVLLWALVMLVGSPLAAQSPRRLGGTASLLREINASVEELATRVSLSVVQVLVTGYGPVDELSRGGEIGTRDRTASQPRIGCDHRS